MGISTMNLPILLLIFFCIIFSLVSSQYNDLLAKKLQNTKLLTATLPSVYILPIDSKYNVDCVRDSNRTIWGETHDTDVFFHKWLLFNYSKTVTSPQKADFFFLPVYTRVCNTNRFLAKNWTLWRELNTELLHYLQTPKIYGESFNLDKVFMIVSHPADKPHSKERGRNVLNIRYSRVDNFQTFNGRDHFIPYTVNASDFKFDKLDRRKYFFYMPCKLPKAAIDDARLWRQVSCDTFAKIPGGNVTFEIVSEDEFIVLMDSSDFCIILPGDTPGTAKVYKAIMAGCIPVYFVSHKSQLPFSRYINWSKFSILVMKEVVHKPNQMQALIRYLQRIRSNKKAFLSLKQNLQLVKPLFDFDKHQWPSVYHFMLLDLVASSACGNGVLMNVPGFLKWKKMDLPLDPITNFYKHLC